MAPDPLTDNSSELQHWGFTLPKDGHHDFECEDSVSSNPAAGRYAIADGASDSFNSRRWSKRLTRAWTTCDAGPVPVKSLAASAAILGDEFQLRWAGKPAPWYLAEKARSGSFAAFLGVQLTKGTWEAVALGDCCLFHEQSHQLQCAFPISDPDGFSNSPILLPSNHRQYESVAPKVAFRQGSWSPGAILTLMSDAVAAWYLRERIARSQKATLLSRFVTEHRVEHLRDMISHERLNCRMRNDDVAILRITWPIATRHQ